MGQLTFDSEKRVWRLETEPHILLRAKRIFGKIGHSTHDYVELSDTAENARDLEWFLSRYPVDVPNRSYLRERTVSQKIRERKVTEIVQSGSYSPMLANLALPLRDYQKVAVELARVNKRLLLADSLGLGKSASSIGLFTEPGTLPALVVTLTHLPAQWEREVHKFFPELKVHIIRNGDPYDLRMDRGRVVSRTPKAFPDVVIINYHKLAKWAGTLGPHIRTVIFDECQELRSGLAREVPAKYTAARYLTERAEFCVGLSGTPVYNYGGEFFSVLDAIHPGVLGTREEFMREWCVSTYGDKPRISDTKAFGTYLRSSGLMLRRTREEVGRELPPYQALTHPVEADTKALESVSDACAELARTILGTGKESHRGEKMMASEEFNNILRQATGIAKAPNVAAFVRMLVEGGEKVVLFGWHRTVYDIWLDQLKDLNPVLYTGSESTKAKDESRQAFIDGDSPILIMSLRSGAGLDGLQHVCKTAVFGELDWSPGVMEQCAGRVYRDGQQHPVIAYFLLADSGSDPIISDILGLKKQQLTGVIDPNADLVEKLQADDGRLKKMAEAYLQQRSKRVA